MKKAILVLGPPRSGTSALSHVLTKLGVDFGDPRRFVDAEIKKFNPIFFELQSLNDLNDDIFKYFGKEWDRFDWLPERSDFDPRLISFFEPKIARFLTEEFGDPRTIGLKDPRFCYTLPLWDAVLNRLRFAVSYAITRRSSDAVFASSQILNHASNELVFRLVAHSNLCAWHFLEGKNFVSVDYEDLIHDPDATIARLCNHLGLDQSRAGEARSVIRNDLNHQQQPVHTSRFRYLAHVIDSESISHDAHLWYREVSTAATFEKKQQIAALSDTLSQREEQLASVCQNLLEEEGQVAAAQQALSNCKARLLSLDQVIAEKDRVIAAAEERIDELCQTLAERDAEIDLLYKMILSFEKSRSWRFTAPVRVAKHHARRFQRALKMLAMLLFKPRQVTRTILEVASTSASAVEERIERLRWDDAAGAHAGKRNLSAEGAQDFAAFAIVLLRLKRWWHSDPRRTRSVNRLYGFLRGDISAARDDENSQFLVHLDKPAWLVKRVNKSPVVVGWGIDLKHRSAAKLRVRVGDTVFFPESQDREDVQNAFERIHDLPVATGFTTTLSVPVGLRRMRVDVQAEDRSWVPVRRTFLLCTPSLTARHRNGHRHVAPPTMSVSTTDGRPEGRPSSAEPNGRLATSQPVTPRRSRIGRAIRLSRIVVAAFLRSPRRFMGSLANYAGSFADFVETQAPGNENTSFALAMQSTSLPDVVPMNLRVVSGLEPRLNVVIPGLVMRAMSGGPNTAINLTYRLAREGIPVRFISSDVDMEANTDLLWDHFSRMSGIDRRLSNVELVSAHNRRVETVIGDRDVFLGTAWWTVQMIKDALTRTRNKRFLYLIQDFEPGLYSWSTRYALALETYSLDFYSIINSRPLSDFLFTEKIGRFADPAFADKCLTFDPALDRQLFYPALSDQSGKKRLLFYARPGAPRNLFELGLVALRRAVALGAFPANEWELLFIGEKLPPVNLGSGVVIRQAPWCDYDGYAKLLRSSTVGLSLMLSPHPSYPPLEMGMCGMLAVTSTYFPKTAELLRNYCRNVIPVEPQLESVVDGLLEASRRSDNLKARRLNAVSELPSTWDAVFNPLIPKVIQFWNECLQPTISQAAA